MERFANFEIKNITTESYVFFDIKTDGGIPHLTFEFGTADPMEMDFESLGKIIALAKWKSISIWAMANENGGGYRTMLTDDIEITHIDSESFFEVIGEDKMVDFKKYDVLMSNSDFKHQKEMREWEK